MQEELQELMRRRRDRVISIILNFKEKECDPHLPRDVQIKLRKVVLDQINDLFDFYSDIMKSGVDDNVVMNEHYLNKLDEIYELIKNA